MNKSRLLCSEREDQFSYLLSHLADISNTNRRCTGMLWSTWGAVSSPSRFLCDFIWRAGVRYIINIKKKYARIFVRGHYLFPEANSFPRAKLEEKYELQGTDNVQGQISKHIFAPNGDYCLYYPSDLFRKARSFENWGIFNNYPAKWRWIVVDVYRAAR